MNDIHKDMILMLIALGIIWTITGLDWAIEWITEIERMTTDGTIGIDSDKGTRPH